MFPKALENFALALTPILFPKLKDPAQFWLAGKHDFSKLDSGKAYWQLPMHSQSIEKTAFCLGFWEFIVVPYGLTGATQNYQ